MSIKIYIINNEVEFWPEKKLLRRVDSPEFYYILNAPASKCFELLLEKRGLVYHDELYQYAWDKEAFEPSPNTLYQNMSILRRGLRKVSSNPDIIATVARKGFKIKESTEVVISQTNVKEQFPVTENNEIVASDIIFHERKCFRYSTVFSALFILTIVSLAAFNYSDRLSEREPIYDYEFISKNNECELYGNKESIGLDVAELNVNGLECHDYPYNYITRFEFASNYSVISCNFSLTAKNKRTTCKTLYVRDYKDE